MPETRHKSTWKARREATGLSLSELARRAEVNKGVLSRIERGWPASAVEAERLLAALAAAEPNVTDVIGSEDGAA